MILFPPPTTQREQTHHVDTTTHRTGALSKGCPSSSRVPAPSLDRLNLVARDHRQDVFLIDTTTSAPHSEQTGSTMVIALSASTPAAAAQMHEHIYGSDDICFSTPRPGSFIWRHQTVRDDDVTSGTSTCSVPRRGTISAGDHPVFSWSGGGGGVVPRPDARETLAITAAALTRSPRDVLLSKALSGGRAALRRAREWIVANAPRPVTGPEIAAGVGINARGLERTFRRHSDPHPQVFLRRYRSERAHHDLAHSPPVSTTVADTAESWGFRHLGGFAEQYVLVYGELPSTTLRRLPGPATY